MTKHASDARFQPGDIVRLDPLNESGRFNLHDKMGQVQREWGRMVYLIWDGNRSHSSYHRDNLKLVARPVLVSGDEPK